MIQGMDRGSAQRIRIVGLLAIMLLFAQLAWAGHAQQHAADTSDACHVCAQSDRFDAACPTLVGHFETVIPQQSDAVTPANLSSTRSVERPPVRAPPSA